MADFSGILKTSAFLSLCRTLKQPQGVFPGRKLRRLKAGEIRILEKQGNICRDWSLLCVADNFSPENIYGSYFLGSCILGIFTKKTHKAGTADVNAGIYFSTLNNAIVGDDALIHRCAFVSRYIIDASACVMDSRLEGPEASTAFGNGTMIAAGIETGGRNVPAFYDLDFAIAQASARGEIPSAELEEFLAAYASDAKLSFGYAGKNCSIGSSYVCNSFIGPGVVLDGASRVADSTLFTETSPIYVGHGCILDQTLVRPGCSFDTQAICTHSFFADCSGASRQALINESYIGPNSHIGEGEVTSSFVGPFVGLHHQSLLIAAFWPGGKGNIGYGANLGSNHSSRSPDLELWPGEGMFFGLGCNIKYPADYSRSPYSIIATGVMTLPQKLEYPFSLITHQEKFLPEVPMGYNRLIPAWVLAFNFYTLWRSQLKFSQRNKTPHIPLETDPLHAGNITLMKDAAEKLASPVQRKDFYLPGDIPGLGKNVLFEEDRVTAVKTYAWFIRFADLRLACADKTCVKQAADIQEYLAHLDTLYTMTLSSRTKDFTRGTRIIPDYAKTHDPAESDQLIIDMKNFIAAEKLRFGV